MLRITNFPAAAAEEVSSKEKPSPAFPLPPSGNRFCFWLLAFLHFANLPINKRSIKYAYQPKRALLSDSLPPNSSSIFSTSLSVYWSQSQNVNKCSRGADFFWILSCVPFLQLPASSTHPQVRGRFLFLSAMVKFISAAADSNQV